MKYIHPMEIASKIMTLIDLSNEQLVIVSPYANFKKWDKMKACLKRAIERGVQIEFYIRDNAETDMEQFAELGIRPIRKENLHAKLYYNEQYGIVSSQNMIRYSDDYSIDIGYETENAEELSQLEDFRKRYLHNGSVSSKVGVENVEQAQQPQESISSAKMNLDQDAVDEIYDFLSRHYPMCSFNCTSTYVFSGNLFELVDVMVGSSFIIKFRHNDLLLKQLESVDLAAYNHALIRSVDTVHKSNSYVDFTPAVPLTTKQLIKVYNDLIKDIRPIITNTVKAMPGSKFRLW